MFQVGADIGDVNLKRTVEEIKRLQEEASSLRQENIQLKVSAPDDTLNAEIGTRWDGPFYYFTICAYSSVGFRLTMYGVSISCLKARKSWKVNEKWIHGIPKSIQQGCILHDKM